MGMSDATDIPVQPMPLTRIKPKSNNMFGRPNAQSSIRRRAKNGTPLTFLVYYVR